MTDPAFLLLAACTRPLADPARTGAIARAAEAEYDPERLVALAHRHRVAGFAEQGLAAAGVILPPKAAAALSAEAGAGRLQALRNAGEEVRVGRALAAAGLDAVFVKGATAAMLAHGTLGLKTSWDIDVLVARDRMADAGAVLAELGYRLQILGGIDDPVRVGRYLRAHKEAEWHHPGRGTVVELHTELSDNRAAIAGIGMRSARETVELMPGAGLETLAPAPLFAYLAYHGTAHLWARLKWLADVAALLRGQDVADLHGRAVAMGAGRTPGVAIALANALLGTEVPAALLAEIRRDPVTRRLIRYANAAMAAPQDAGGRLARPLGELFAYARAQGWLVPGWSHRWRSAARFVTQPYTDAHLSVPNWAMPAAILAALPARLLFRRARLRREQERQAGDQRGGNTASRP